NATRATKCSHSSAAVCGVSASRSCLVTGSPSASRRTTRSGESSPSEHASQTHLPPKTTDSRHSTRSRGGRPRTGARRPRPRATATVSLGSQLPISLQPIVCDTAPVPFASLNLEHRLLEGTRDLGYKETRPIQTAVIPLALSGADLIACAETGTGKTCAFVVPTLQTLLTKPARHGA